MYFQFNEQIFNIISKLFGLHLLGQFLDVDHLGFQTLLVSIFLVNLECLFQELALSDRLPRDLG